VALTERDSGGVTLEITDTGQGLDPAAAEGPGLRGDARAERLRRRRSQHRIRAASGTPFAWPGLTPAWDLRCPYRSQSRSSIATTTPSSRRAQALARQRADLKIVAEPTTGADAVSAASKRHPLRSSTSRCRDSPAYKQPANSPNDCPITDPDPVDARPRQYRARRPPSRSIRYVQNAPPTRTSSTPAAPQCAGDAFVYPSTLPRTCEQSSNRTSNQSGSHERFTPRESEVTKLVAEATPHKHRQTCSSLAPKRSKTHRTNISQKGPLNIRDRVELHPLRDTRRTHRSVTVRE